MTLSTADFELLLQSNRILSSKLDSADVLQAVMELATQVVRAEAASLLLLDEAANELYFDVTLGSVKDSVKQIRLKVGEGIAGWVAKEKLPLIVNDVSKDSRFTGKVDKSTQFKTRSILAVPLISKGRLVGVVEAINKANDGEFTSQDQEAFEVFGSQAAVAIENARLFSEMMREKEKLNIVVGEMSDGVLLLDTAGKVLLLNEAGSRFLGVKREDAIGKKFADLLPGFEATPPIEDISRFKDKLTLVELSRHTGKDFYLSAVVLRIGSDKKSSREGHLVILRDMTEEKRGEKLKRNFLSLVSHKLRTPLTVIVGYGPMLMTKIDQMGDFEKKAVKAICEQGEQLNGLVDKLLRFTIVESETLTRNPELKKVEGLMKEAVNSGVTNIEGQTVELKIDSSLSSLPDVFVDGPLTVEVFKNLLENAVKFNDKKKKEIRVSAVRKNGAVQVTIADNGVGIPGEEKEKVFQKFYQIENSFTGQVPGAGLGLALCKKVVEAMGGSIELDSELGKGTRVRITFPCRSR